MSYYKLNDKKISLRNLNILFKASTILREHKLKNDIWDNKLEFVK